VLCVRDNHGAIDPLSHLIILLFDHLLFARRRADLEIFFEKRLISVFSGAKKFCAPGARYKLR